MSIVTLNDRGVRSVTTFGSLNTGSMVFIKKLTASSSANLSFVNGSSDVVLDSTYKEYLFTFNNMQSAGTDVAFQVNFRDGSSAYDATKTTTFFYAENAQDASSTAFSYLTSRDEAQSSDAQHLTTNIGRTGDNSASGQLHLFNPSSTTFVKHFISRTNNKDSTSPNYSQDVYVAGYCNVTAAIDAVQFSMSSGNITVGDICLYGIN